MSVVTSEFFKREKQQRSQDDFGEDYTYSIQDILKTYALDDKFHLELSHYSMYHTFNSITLNVSEAKKLKKQLEEFISLNS